MIFKFLAGTHWLTDESGFDMVEYALIMAGLAFAATAAMDTVASGIDTALSFTIGQMAKFMGTYIT